MTASPDRPGRHSGSPSPRPADEEKSCPDRCPPAPATVLPRAPGGPPVAECAPPGRAATVIVVGDVQRDLLGRPRHRLRTRPRIRHWFRCYRSPAASAGAYALIPRATASNTAVAITRWRGIIVPPPVGAGPQRSPTQSNPQSAAGKREASGWKSPPPKAPLHRHCRRDDVIQRTRRHHQHAHRHLSPSNSAARLAVAAWLTLRKADCAMSPVRNGPRPSPTEGTIAVYRRTPLPCEVACKQM